MASTTTGISNFNLDFGEIVDEAYMRCGVELRSGMDFRSARRSMGLLLASWSNLGINLWTIEEGSIVLHTGVIKYDLPVDTVDLLDHVTRTGTGQNQQDLTITRITESTYSAIPNKNAQGRPIQVWINRKSGQATPSGVASPTINIWPCPNAPDNQYTFVYWRMRRINNAGDANNIQDIPYRFLPPLISGLAYYLSMKVPNMDINRAIALKGVYDEDLQAAKEEDRDRSSWLIVPRQGYI